MKRSYDDANAPEGARYSNIQIGESAHVHLGDNKHALPDPVLGTLFFPEISARFEKIEEAYKGTCQCVFGDGARCRNLQLGSDSKHEHESEFVCLADDNDDSESEDKCSDDAKEHDDIVGGRSGDQASMAEAAVMITAAVRMRMQMQSELCVKTNLRLKSMMEARTGAKQYLQSRTIR